MLIATFGGVCILVSVKSVTPGYFLLLDTIRSQCSDKRLVLCSEIKYIPKEKSRQVIEQREYYAKHQFHQTRKKMLHLEVCITFLMLFTLGVVNAQVVRVIPNQIPVTGQRMVTVSGLNLDAVATIGFARNELHRG